MKLRELFGVAVVYFSCVYLLFNYIREINELNYRSAHDPFLAHNLSWLGELAYVASPTLMAITNFPSDLSDETVQYRPNAEPDFFLNYDFCQRRILYAQLDHYPVDSFILKKVAHMVVHRVFDIAVFNHLRHATDVARMALLSLNSIKSPIKKEMERVLANKTLVIHNPHQGESISFHKDREAYKLSVVVILCSNYMKKISQGLTHEAYQIVNMFRCSYSIEDGFNSCLNALKNEETCAIFSMLYNCLYFGSEALALSAEDEVNKFYNKGDGECSAPPKGNPFEYQGKEFCPR